MDTSFSGRVSGMKVVGDLIKETQTVYAKFNSISLK